ncbi:MAG: carboxypeptidase regulatory-like domain-containing protein [Ferruginibacter sp.]
MKRNHFTKKTGFLCLSVLLILALFTGCKRTDIIDATTNPTIPAGGPVNDLTQVIAGVSGIVLDESNAPIANATVTSGTATTSTNSNGMFIFNGISLSKENGNVTVIKTGYFKGVRSFKTIEGKNNTVKIRLMARVLSGTVNATTGGTITSNGGATIVFPSNAFVTSAGAVYMGSVKVYSRWIDPTAANLPDIIPGDLRGISAAGVENILETYGMAGAELEDVSGNVLKITPGKTATIGFPIPAALSAAAPATITLWHFDDATARWKENGTATKAGNTYTAQVDKFSFWNCDVGSTNFVNLDFTILNAVNGSPMVSTTTRIKRVSDGSYGYGITNNAGFVSGLVPKNEQLVLQMISSCGTVIYSQNINSLSVNTSLGNINASLPASQTLTFTGTVLNCNAAPVSNGYVSLYVTGGGGYVLTSATGSFSFSLINCSGATLMYNCQAVDNATTQQSTPITGAASIGTINLGNINACGTVAGANVYVAGSIGNTAVVWKNGVATNLTNGTYPAAAKSVFVSGTDVYVAGYEHSSWGDIAKVWKNGVATNLGGGLYPNGSSYDAHANSVFVSGTDVYVAGFAADGATIWKNGVATKLAGGSTQNYAEAFSVFVSGTDVYVAVTAEVPFPNHLAAKVWKNSVTTNLTTNGATTAGANSVFVSGTDVYVAGGEQIQGSGGAKVWKNGVATTLSNVSSGAKSVFISGTDVYVAGEEGVPTLWENGVATYLSNVGGQANSIFVYGTDVYVAGVEYDGSGHTAAKVWKNGLLINLSSGTTNSFANSIYVK